MGKKANSVISQLQIFESEISRLENQIYQLEQKMLKLNHIQRNHLVRVKNREEISDEFIHQGKLYQDLSPEKAWKMYQNRDYNFILIDVSSRDYSPACNIPEALKMPWENFAEHSLALQSKTTPILVISEDGTRSILACEFLISRGFYNCSNISGGHLYWKGVQLRGVESA